MMQNSKQKKILEYKDQLNILDCTFRDGGYYNKWDFNINLVKKYINTMLKLEVKIVELGFRFLDKSEKLGILASTNDELLDDLEIPKKLKVAVMINAKEFLNNKKGIQKSVDSVFAKSVYSRVDLVRVAIHVGSALDCYNLLKYINSLGYSVALNLMQSSSISEKKLTAILRKLNKWNFLKVIYFADTFGDMDPSKVLNISSLIKMNYSGDVGFHAHNNKGFALINSITAIQNGVSYIDATIMGMGRGAGNTQTENLLVELESRALVNKKNSINNLLPILLRDFENLKFKYGWGSNLYYYLAAEYKIHPTYIQTMLDDNKYVAEGIINVINFLKNMDSSSYDDENMIKAETGKIGKLNGKWTVKDLKNKRDILLVGAGMNVKKYIKQIQFYIEKNKPMVVSLNFNKYLNSKYIDYYLACDHTRIMLEAYDYSNLDKPLIMPISRVDVDIKKQLKKENLCDFGLQTGKDNFTTISKNGCILKKPLAISYALSFANASRARNILFAGMDGYAKNDPNNGIMDDLFSEYNLKNLRKFYSIIPTNYQIRTKYIT